MQFSSLIWIKIILKYVHYVYLNIVSYLIVICIETDDIIIR